MRKRSLALADEMMDLGLSPLEVRLLVYLIENEGRIVRRDELIKRVWRPAKVSNKRAVDVSIGKLRRKVWSLNLHIVTAYGRGYRLIREKNVN